MNTRIDGFRPPLESQALKKRPQIDRRFAAFIEDAAELKVSQHAQKRMTERGFSLEDRDWSNIHSAVDELEGKGSKNSLLIYKDMALIANIHNRTIITALNRDEVDTITNIDSTKFIK